MHISKSDICQSSVAQQEIVIKHTQQKLHRNLHKSYKFVHAHEIKTYQRLSQVKNYQFKQSYPSSFSQDYHNSQPYLHFISQNDQHYFIVGQKKQYDNDILVKRQDQLLIKMGLSNVLRQNILRLQLSKFSKNNNIVIEYNELLDDIKTLKFKYSITLLQNSFLIRVILSFDEQQKIWKQIEIPLIQNNLIIEIQQFNNEQTDIKINHYLFHLILKMPYCSSSYYSLVYDRTLQIDKIQVISFDDKHYPQPSEANCSKECQLI